MWAVTKKQQKKVETLSQECTCIPVGVTHNEGSRNVRSASPGSSSAARGRTISFGGLQRPELVAFATDGQESAHQVAAALNFIHSLIVFVSPLVLETSRIRGVSMMYASFCFVRGMLSPCSRRRLLHVIDGKATPRNLFFIYTVARFPYPTVIFCRPPPRFQVLMAEGGGVDTLTANTIQDSWAMVKEEVSPKLTRLFLLR